MRGQAPASVDTSEGVKSAKKKCDGETILHLGISAFPLAAFVHHSRRARRRLPSPPFIVFARLFCHIIVAAARPQQETTAQQPPIQGQQGNFWFFHDIHPYTQTFNNVNLSWSQGRDWFCSKVKQCLCRHSGLSPPRRRPPLLLDMYNRPPACHVCGGRGPLSSLSSPRKPNV